MKELEYRYIPEDNIFAISGENILSAEHALDMVEFIIKHAAELKYCTSILLDLRKTQMPDPTADYATITPAVNEGMNASMGYHMAIITDTPRETAISIMLSKKITSMKIEVFSTEAAATSFLREQAALRPAPLVENMKHKQALHKYSYNEEQNIFRMDFFGEVDLEELANFGKVLFENKLIPLDCHKIMLVDNDTMIDVKGIVVEDIGPLLYAPYEDVISKTRVAICTENLELHALVLSLRKSYQFPVNRAFSFEEDALAWLSTNF